MSLLIQDEESTPNYKLVIGKHNAKEKGFDSPPREYVYFIQLYKYSKDWNTRKMIFSETLWNFDYTDFTKNEYTKWISE